MAIALILLWASVVVAEKEQPVNFYSMELISSLPGTNVGGLTPFGEYLYFGEGWAGETIRVVDTTNPAFPKIVGSTVGSFDLTFEGNYAYGLTGGLKIYDVSDPAQPVLLNTYYDFPTYQGDTPGLLDVAVYQQTAYVSYYYFIDRCYEGGNLDVIDVSDPLNPVRLLTLAPVGGWHLGWGDIEIIGHYAYIISYGVEVFDLTNPHEPQFIDFFGSEGTGMFPLTSKMTIFNREMYVTTAQFSTPCFGVSEMWQLFNFSNPTYLTEVFTYLDEIIGIYRIADGYIYAYLPGVGAQVISVVDHVNPVASFVPFFPHSIAVIDGFIYAGHEEGLDMLRMSAVAEWVTPAVSTTLGYTDSYGLATQVAVGAGAVISPTRLSYLPYPAVTNPPTSTVFVAAFDLVGYGEQFTLERFSEPVTLTLDYGQTRVARAVIGEESRLLWWAGSEWQEAAESCNPVSSYWRDPAHFRLALAVCRPGKYVLVAPAGPLFLPALFR